MKYTPSIFEQAWENSDAVKICCDIVRINSVNPPGNELEVSEYCAEYMLKLGLEVQMLIHERGKRASVLGCLRNNRKTDAIPGVLICSHIDTVPVGEIKWEHDPYGAEIYDGKIWGRGSSDMKSGAAVSLASLKALIDSGIERKGDLWIGFSAGEEVDFLGAHEIAKHTEMLPLQVILIPEPSSNDIYLGQKGALWLEIELFGKTAHGAMPDQGINAVEAMTQLIAKFKAFDFNITEHALLNKFTSTITTIAGGIKTNVVPDTCKITVDCRTLPEQSHDFILITLESLLAEIYLEYPGLTGKYTITNNFPAVVTDETLPPVSQFVKIHENSTQRKAEFKGVNFFTDGAVLCPALRTPMIIYGPGHAYLAHQPNEFVEISLLEEAYHVYSLALAEYLC